MTTCPRCGRLITDTAAEFCPNCGMALAPANDQAPQQSQETAPPYPQAAPEPYPQSYPQPYPQPYPAPYSQPMSQPYPPTFAAPPTQPPMGPPTGPGYPPPGYGAPPTGPAYGAGAPPSGYPGGYSSGYPGAYQPGAYAPGANWRPADSPPRRRWGRIIWGVVGLLVVIAIAAGVYDQLQANPPVSPNARATAAANSVNSNAMLSDPLTSNVNGWSVDPNHCFFSGGAYHVADGYLCFAPIGDQSDGTQSVTAKQVRGPLTRAYGLAMRWVSHGNYYFFGIDSNSKWVFYKVVNSTATLLQPYTANSVIKGGLNVSNSLSATMTGSTFDCYVNGVKVGTVHDSTFSSGQWGLESSTGIETVFNDYLAQ